MPQAGAGAAALGALACFVGSAAAVVLRQRSGPAAQRALKYVSFSDSLLDPTNTLVVDCTHTSCRQLTHHLKLKGQRALHLDVDNLGADSSTEQVLKALERNALSSFACVSTNHFDVDSFLSVWTACNPKLALEHYSLLKAAAEIGDFREAKLDAGGEAEYKALALVCWLNSEERRLFYRPFEGSISRKMGEGEEGDAKFSHFLPMFKDVLHDTMAFSDQWVDEYQRVVGECALLESTGGVQRYDHIGLVLLTTSEPMHYYSLFSSSLKCDIVLAAYSNNRYEVEIKYTTFVDLSTRPTLPRVEMQHLADTLNALEQGNGGDLSWHANRINDSGPLLRIESKTKHLTKSERYGHPFERPIHSSSIPHARFLAIVTSYFEYGLHGVKPKKGWTWSEYQSFNAGLDWGGWKVPDPSRG